MAVDKADAFPSPIIPSTQPGSPDKIDFYSIFEPTLSFSNDQLSPGENDFLDLLQTESPHSEPKVLHAGHDSAKSAQLSFPSDGLGLMSGVVFGDELSSSSASIIEDVGKLIQRNWQSQKFKDHFQLAELPEATPGESSESAASQVPSYWKELSLSSWDASPGPTSIIDRIPCECLSSLYLALDSLSRLPKDADGALRIARRASEVAHDVARCTKCSDIAVEDLLKTPVMQCFQNRMCLATLVPSTCNAYAAILDMIDKQAAAARENGNTVRLSFNEVGSIFPTSGADKDWTKLLHCNNHGIGPDLWRSIMRAIIRVDVCGVDIPPTDMLGDIHYRYGLRYVVKLMEEGSGERHKYMDKLAAEGRLHEIVVTLKNTDSSVWPINSSHLPLTATGNFDIPFHSPHFDQRSLLFSSPFPPPFPDDLTCLCAASISPSVDRTSDTKKLHVVTAGAIAGLVSRFVIAPLDVIKIRLQLQAHSLSDPLEPKRRAPPYHGAIEMLRHTVRHEGITGLWKGNVPAELMYVCYAAAQFGTYRSVTLFLESSGLSVKLPDAAESFVAGASAGAMATTLTYPLDLLRTRFAAQGRKRVYTSLHGAVGSIWRDEGFRGFFRGLAPGLSQIVPYMGIFFVTYEQLRIGLVDLDLPWGSGDATAGVVGSVLAKTAVFPLDLVRKRIQVQGPTRSRYIYGDIPEYTGALKALKSIVRREGVRGLFRGLPIGLLKSAPTGALTIWAYERTLNTILELEKKKEEFKNI
ncbi:solute carrier family 25 (mitochondrial thiamine pyrophosphate transporter), member 19 [Geosmithia morbida]|uniref:Mitochondrial thiamine pyrophosphate carrier 1 n=1 Tax=Geosmithia morbida TaxID=1094350 RepID=A0A9P4YSN6_9HYPO|nr:solute carrier family 25 (mitochondrial thiamine pyrophosphate transporter), member 19 [Geosmithia morbida]KAF4122393.1 solute carrier family 25 (mitochondrial thiamine pyrophosphate transporter), member 19 [Geosmithia morbida]